MRDYTKEERECLQYAVGDFWTEYEFYERIKNILNGFDRIFLRDGDPSRLPDYTQELNDVCTEAARFWKRYAENALKEFNEYEEK